MKNFKEISPDDLNESAVRLIGKEWMLITAGTIGKWNTMTASWGALGQLWKKPVAFTFIRPTRHTFEFANREPLFTLCFFEEKYRKALSFCGEHSGRECDKAKETGLTPFEVEPGTVAFEEARRILVCRMLYFQDIKPEHFCDPVIEMNYPKKDYHRMFVGEVQKVLSR
ncbi:MAG: flavin reductase [Kiritimatiellales bacterium]